MYGLLASVAVTAKPAKERSVVMATMLYNAVCGFDVDVVEDFAEDNNMRAENIDFHRWKLVSFRNCDYKLSRGPLLDLNDKHGDPHLEVYHLCDWS